ncbi:MAG: hypothetical protein HYV26_04685 [Candidatus Hydrogenedentes bacterium]|nr:hypothetical protein [Candidatus Hydrogenedentota bacterium]
MGRLQLVLAYACILTPPALVAQECSFHLTAEIPLAPFGGIPFIVDLNRDGQAEVLWLQSPGLFHSKVFDVAPWLGKFTPEERAHFCLTATDAAGKVLWQVGAPWAGERPFVTHCAERALDCADLDGDGTVEVVCVRRDELLVLNGETGEIERSATLPADNGQIVRLAHTGPGAADWTILVKNSESAYPPHEYANPAWFYDTQLNLLRTADFLGAGHAPRACDVDGDGLDEFLIGYNLVDNTLETVWSFKPVEDAAWDAAEMHVDFIDVGEVDRRLCAAMAASDTTYLFDLRSGELLWKHGGVHPQSCKIGRVDPSTPGNQVVVFNKRADIQLFDETGTELWRIMPPRNFPLGEAAPCQRQAFHTFDPLTLLPGVGAGGADLLIFSDAGWPYVIGPDGQRCLEFPYTPNAAQDWGEVPGRPDDYGYGFYVRAANFDGDPELEILINDRRFAWVYEAEHAPQETPAPRSDGSVLNADLENYTDGVVQALNAGVRWLGDPFSNLDEGQVEITRGFAFEGGRCAAAATEREEQIGRIRFQPRFDAPGLDGHAVAESCFLVAQRSASARLLPADLKDFVVWSAEDRAGQPFGITILANGSAETGLYQLDVVHGCRRDVPVASTARTDRVRFDLKQTEWLRIILQHEAATGPVHLWTGPPDHETYAGAFPAVVARSPSARLTLRTIEVGDTSTKNRRGAGCWDNLRVGFALKPGAAGAPPEPKLRDLREEAPALEAPIRVGREKQLFIDNAFIESMSGLTRTFHAAVRHPANPLLVPETPWEVNGTWFVPFDVLRESAASPLRLWYGAYRKSENKLTHTCLAESQDGVAWTRPNLGLLEFEGSKENNIVWQGRGLKPNFDPLDPDPARRYKGMMRSDAFTPMYSPDGIHWTEGPRPVISQAYDATTFHYDPIGKKWIAAVKMFKDGKRARGYAESSDYEHWSDTCLMLVADERDAPQDELYALRLFRYESVYLGLLKVYHVATDRCDIQLAISRDAKHWERPDRVPFLANSPEVGAYDYGNLDAASDPLLINGQLCFFYGGRSGLHNAPPEITSGSLCAATLRPDGFVSLDAGTEPGTLTTKPLLLEGGTLYVNVNAANGTLRAEVLDPTTGAPLPGYSLTDFGPITEDETRFPVLRNCVFTSPTPRSTLSGQSRVAVLEGANGDGERRKKRREPPLPGLRSRKTC